MRYNRAMAIIQTLERENVYIVELKSVFGPGENYDLISLPAYPLIAVLSEEGHWRMDIKMDREEVSVGELEIFKNGRMFFTRYRQDKVGFRYSNRRPPITLFDRRMLAGKNEIAVIKEREVSVTKRVPLKTWLQGQRLSVGENDVDHGAGNTGTAQGPAGV